MAPLVGADAKADDERPAQAPGQVYEIGYAHHDIIFLIGMGVLPDQEEIPQVPLGRFQLDGGKDGLRRRAGEIVVLGDISGCDGGKERAVADGVGFRDDGGRVIGAESFVDLGPCVACPVERGEVSPLEAVAKSCRLIPDFLDPGSAVRV